MKLSYNVLCIDDNLSSLKRVKDDFEEYNLKVGIQVIFHDINAKISPLETFENYRTRLIKKISDQFSASKKAFEFILIDLHLGLANDENFNGSDLINIIRDSHTLYRPIIFYSAGESASHETAKEQLEEATIESNVSGRSIFIIARENLSIFLEEIAKEMHIEEHKINRVRGLLMDQVSEFDASIIEAIGKEDLWNDVQADKRDKVTKEFKDRVNSQLGKSKALFDTTENMSYEEIQAYVLANPRDVNTFTKGKVLREMLKHIRDLESYGNVLSDGINGPDSLIAIRNYYSHQIADELEKTHNVDKCKLIREESRRQVKNIKQVSIKGQKT